MFAVRAELLQQGHRYEDLYDALSGVSYKALTETLRRAERDGLIAPHLDGERMLFQREPLAVRHRIAEQRGSPSDPGSAAPPGSPRQAPG